jgi:hypothetical protein
LNHSLERSLRLPMPLEWSVGAPVIGLFMVFSRSAHAV